MLHLYGSMKGSRGKATRCGTASSGIHCHVRGWTFGVMVQARLDVQTGRDVYAIFATSGSDGTGRRELIATVALTADSIPGEPEWELIRHAPDVCHFEPHFA